MNICGILAKHGILFISILLLILGIYWYIYKDISTGEETPEIIANVTQGTISSGLTAVSIVLPLTVGILGYSVQQRNAATEFLFCACTIFVISLFAARWNLFRLPGLVTTLNIASDMKTAFFQVIQLYSLFYGFFYLVLGAWKIVK